MVSPAINQLDRVTRDYSSNVPPHQQRYRWLILALLWLLYFSFGVVTRSPSPLITPIIRDLEMSYGQMGFVLGSWQMTYIILAIAAGVLMDRWGIRRSIFLGALVIGISTILRSTSTGFYSLLKKHSSAMCPREQRCQEVRRASKIRLLLLDRTRVSNCNSYS